MGKGNGKTKGNVDLEHELPAAEDAEESAAPAPVGIAAENAAASETEQLKAERDALLDRLARLQAEFDNSRVRRGGRHQECSAHPRQF